MQAVKTTNSMLGVLDITHGVRMRDVTKDDTRPSKELAKGTSQRKMAYFVRETGDTAVTDSNSHTAHDIKVEALIPLVFIFGLVLFAMMNA